MKRWAVVGSALVFAASAVAYSPEAEARRWGRGWGWGVGGGIVAAALIGGAIAASAGPGYYSYYPRRAYYAPSYSYYSSPYYSSYYSPYVYRPVRYYRPARYYRAARYYRY
jgi:hypothetical protein